jgi:hypothetical protein
VIGIDSYVSPPDLLQSVGGKMLVIVYVSFAVDLWLILHLLF